jgi:hypothetical protein
MISSGLYTLAKKWSLLPIFDTFKHYSLFVEVRFKLIQIMNNKNSNVKYQISSQKKARIDPTNLFSS